MKAERFVAMKVTLITGPFGALPPVALGAVEKLFFQLACEWVKLGSSVTIVCAGGGDNEKINYVRLKRYKRTGRTLTDIPFDLIYSLKALWRMPKCDVLVCNTFWSPIAAPLFRWKYKKLVYGVHRYPKGQFVFYRFVHSFICVSTAIGEALKELCPSVADKIKVICNPIDVTVFKPLDLPCEKQSAYFDIVYTGRIAEEKGLVFLARAAQELSKDAHVLKGRMLRLLLVGAWARPQGGGGTEYVKGILKEFPATVLLGPIYEPSKLAEIIRACDVYCYPTIAERGEAFGIAPLEAIACGVPVVLPRFRCFSDYARDGENCVMYDDPAKIADAIRDAVRKKERGGSVLTSTCGVERFSIAKIANEYLSHLALLCAR